MEVTGQYQTLRCFNPRVGPGAGGGRFCRRENVLILPELDPRTVQPVPSRYIDYSIPGTVYLLFWLLYWDTYAEVRNQFINDRALTTSDCRHTMRTWCAVLLECKRPEHKTSVGTAHTRTFCPACNGSKAIHWKTQKCGLMLVVQSGCHPERWNLFHCRYVFWAPLDPKIV